MIKIMMKLYMCTVYIKCTYITCIIDNNTCWSTFSKKINCQPFGCYTQPDHYIPMSRLSSEKQDNNY